MAAAVLLMVTSPARAQSLPAFDFTQPEVARAWGEPHDIAALRPTADGLEITISGSDPYFHGPARDYPVETPLWLIARLKSEQAGSAELFYFPDRAKAGQSVRFNVPGGKWTEVRVQMPSLGPGHRLRLDPPGTSGKLWLAAMRFEKRVVLPSPVWPDWNVPGPATTRVLAAGGLEMFTGDRTPLGFELRVNRRSVGFGHPRPRVGYLQGDEVRWLDLAEGAVDRRPRGEDAFEFVVRQRDADGADWTVRQEFQAQASGVIRATTVVSVSRDRAVVFLPMHTLFAGEGSFGARKHQGLFAGLEYLADEPSRSEADIVGPESNRRVPASHKITSPLMAIQAENRYVGLIWEPADHFAALFDSPDRTFGSGGHAMGVLFPGGDGMNREEGSLLPYAGQTLKAGAELKSVAWFIGGAGASVIPAVQQYVTLRGLPERPDPGLGFQDYVTLAAQGWLESKCRETNFYRHAVWPGFNPQPAADAAVFETWLAGHTADAARAGALLDAAAGALSVVPARNYFHSAIGHVRAPVAPLVFGAVHEAAEEARQVALGQLRRFEPDGSVRYRAGSKGTDYGRTHFAPDANGLTAKVVATLLEAAAFCGDRELIAEAITKLRALEKFEHTVPRGAQTWEIPLHTPDILASAYLVRAFTLGFELTGERTFLDQALYWAWTGVPFAYLVNPTGQPVGPWSTIAVLGATNWKAPVWFGRPVQWCGMVYADALHKLARHDAAGPWQRIADGITGAGLQHTWRADDAERVGLLPDFFELREQTRAGPAINPGTVGASAIRFYGQPPWHDFHAFRRCGLLVHAPGGIVPGLETDRSVSFTVRGWPTEPWRVLVTGFTAAPTVRINGRTETHEFHATEGRLILKLTGDSRVEIER